MACFSHPYIPATNHAHKRRENLKLTNFSSIILIFMFGLRKKLSDMWWVKLKIENHTWEHWLKQNKLTASLIGDRTSSQWKLTFYVFFEDRRQYLGSALTSHRIKHRLKCPEERKPLLSRLSVLGNLFSISRSKID